MIEEYLRELRAGLRTRPQETERIIAEAQDHLAQTVAAGLAAGLTEIEAQEAAISAFGSVNAVVAAHHERRTLAAVAEDLFMSAWQLGGVGLAAIGVSGVVAAIMNATLGRAFVGQAPPGVTHPAASCKYWLSAWQEAHTCAQAAMLESSSDAVVLRVIAGIVGVALLEGFFIARYIQRRRGIGRPPLLRGYFPLVAAGVFAVGAAALSLMQITGLGVTEGPGSFVSGIIVAAAAAAGYAVALSRRLRRRPAPPSPAQASPPRLGHMPHFRRAGRVAVTAYSFLPDDCGADMYDCGAGMYRRHARHPRVTFPSLSVRLHTLSLPLYGLDQRQNIACPAQGPGQVNSRRNGCCSRAIPGSGVRPDS